jgi:hypothetical protein
MCRFRLATVSIAVLFLLWQSGHGSAASITDPLLDPLRDYLINTVAKYVSDAIRGTIEVGALRGSLFGSPVLHDIVLRDSQGDVIARIEEIRLEYNFLSLIRGHLAINAVEIVRPRFTIVQAPDGTLNISDLLRRLTSRTRRRHRPRRSLPSALGCPSPCASSACRSTMVIWI